MDKLLYDRAIPSAFWSIAFHIFLAYHGATGKRDPMTVEEFLEIHPDEDVDLQVPEGRVLLDHGQVQRLLGGRPVIVCKTGVQDAQYMQAEDLLNQVVYLTHQTCSLWRVSAAHDPKLQKPVRYWPQLKRGISL